MEIRLAAMPILFIDSAPDNQATPIGFYHFTIKHIRYNLKMNFLLCNLFYGCDLSNAISFFTALILSSKYGWLRNKSGVFAPDELAFNTVLVVGDAL